MNNKMNKTNNYQIRIPIKFDLKTLNLIMAYTISDNSTINRGRLVNVRKLFDLIDMNMYSKDYLSEVKIHFVKKILEARLDLFIENKDLIYESCKNEMYKDIQDDVIKEIEEITLKTSEIKFVSSFISDKLTYSFMYIHAEPIQQLLNKFKLGDYKNLKTLSKDFREKFSEVINEIRKVENLENSETVFSLTDDLFEVMVTQTVEKLSNPSNILKTGIQKINEMINGGFESGRIYMFLGMSGGFKSGLLLNLAYQIKMNNLKFMPKDETKIPTILMITQENSVEETIDRLFSLSVASNNTDELRNYTAKDAIKLLKKKGKLELTVDNNVDLVVMYKAGKSISTADLYTIIDDLEDDGREVICLIHDYIKRIRSVQKTSEIRLELGYIVDEMKSLAIAKDIPVITASQLNRESARTLDSAVEYNKTDLARLLGKANVGESWTMIENSDFVAIINRERKLSNNVMYLSVKEIKKRMKQLTDLTYFNHPFDSKNTMRLLQDVNGPCLSEMSLSDENDMVGVSINEVKHGKKNGKKRDVISHSNDTEEEFDLDDYLESSKVD